MAVFIDDLGLELITLVFASGLTVYLTGTVYLEYRKNGAKNVESTLRRGAFPLIFLGILITVMGIWGEMTWQFPSPLSKFNILFNDPYTVFGVILLAMSLSIQFKQKLQIVGFFAFMGGIMSVYYGILLFQQGLTSSPLGAFAMYFAFGMAGIFTFPATLAYDSLESGSSRSPGVWTVPLILFWLAFLASSVFAAIIGFPAVNGHLLSTP